MDHPSRPAIEMREDRIGVGARKIDWHMGALYVGVY